MALRGIAALLALLVLAPATARADTQWNHDSPISEQSTGFLACAGSDDEFDRLLPSIDFAEAFLDPAAGAPLGGVQYVRIQWYAVGGDDCTAFGGLQASIEVILPPGAELALDRENPALCGFAITLDAAACPVLTAPGEFGGTQLLDARSGQGTPWPVSDGVNKTRLQVPVRFTRPVASFGASAEKRCNAAPCPATESGGRVQFAVRFRAGAAGQPSFPLVSTIGLLGGKTLLSRPLRKRVSRAALRRGVKVHASAVEGMRVRATLTAGRRTVARTSRRATRSGEITLRLRAKTAARKLRLTLTAGGVRQRATLRVKN